MFGLTPPAIAAAGAAAVLAVGGMTALPATAVAASGDPGVSSSTTTDGPGATGGAPAPYSAAPADPAAGTDAGTDAGADSGTDAGPGTDTAADPGAADPGTGTGTDAGAADPSAGQADVAGGSGGAGTSGSGWHGMDVTPRTAAPGAEVTLRLTASCSGAHEAKASADVFVNPVTLAPAKDGSGLEGQAFIKSDAAAGSYTVSVECDGVAGSATATITVVPGGGTTGTPGAPASPPSAHPVGPERPEPAGGGGTAQLAAGPAVAGTSTGALLATGGFAAAGLTGLVLHRRRGANRG